MTAAVAPSFRRHWRGPRFALAVPAMVWYALFFVVPIALIVAFSFGTKDTKSLVPVDLTHLSFKNYGKALSGSNVKVFWATMRIASLATLLCLMIGFPVAYFLAFKVREKRRGLLLALIVVPSFTSFLIRTVAWRIPLSKNGTLSTWLQDWGWISGPINLLETSTAVQIALVYNYLGFMILPLFVALDRIDAGMREASKDLGAGRFSTFASVTMPLAGSGIAAGVLLTFIPMCGDYVTANVLGGANGNMIGNVIASQFQQAQDWALGSAMAVVMIAGVLASLAVGAGAVWAFRAGLRLASPATLSVKKSIFERSQARRLARSGAAPRSATGERRSAMNVGFAAWTVLALVFLILPIGLVVLHSFNRGGAFVIWSGHTSLKWWSSTFDSGVVVSALIRFAAIVGAFRVAARLARGKSGQVASVVRVLAVPVGLVVAIVAVGLRTAWFDDLFTESIIGKPVKQSLIAAIGATTVAVLIGGLAGVALARRPGKWTVWFLGAIFLILVTPEIMDAIALSGWMTRLTWPFDHGIGPVGAGTLRLWVGQSLYASAVVTLIVRARLAGLDESLEEAAGDLGAPPGRAFRQITLPLISSALIAGGLLSFTLCLDNTIISSFIVRPGSTTFPVALFAVQRSTIKPFWGVGAVVLFVLTMLVLAFVARVLRKSGDSSSQIAATLTGS